MLFESRKSKEGKTVGQQNIIELNGKKYDAITGALLSESRVKAMSPQRHAQYTPRHSGRVIDGFISNRHTQQTKHTPQVHHQSVKHVTVNGTPQAIHTQHVPTQHQANHTAAHVKAQAIPAHQPQKAHTLMRHILKKPEAHLKPAIKTTSPAEMMARPVSDLAIPLEKKMSVTQVNPFRLSRAKQIARSQHIRRYSPSQTVHHPRAMHIPATTQQQPVRAQAHISIPTQTAATQPAHNDIDIFTAALARATSHEQPHVEPAKHRSRSHRKAVNALAGIGAFLVLGGFVAYLNMSAIEIQVASVHAGFHAQLPGYQPSGYALRGGVKTQRGLVAMTFASGDQHYTIKQQSSNWDSQTLRDQNADTSGTPDKTIESQGRTILMYGNSHAVWVDGSVRYDLTGNAVLSADQLAAIAAST